MQRHDERGEIGFRDVLNLVDQHHDGGVAPVRRFADGDEEIGEIDGEIARRRLRGEAKLEIAQLYLEGARKGSQHAERVLHVRAGFLHAVEAEQDAVELRRELARERLVRIGLEHRGLAA
ncbi:MAG: hypothetical protein WDM79_01100 [Terricaulis sp.]